MSLKSYALTTVSRYKTFAKISGSSDDTRIENLINGVTDFVESYLGYRVQETAYSNEVYDTNVGDNIVLKNFPVNSSETFTFQRRKTAGNEDEWETIATERYFVDYEAGIVFAAGNWRFPRTRKGFRVSYTAGYDYDNSATFLMDTTAGDLELAAWMLVSSGLSRGGSGGGIKEEAIGDYRVVYMGTVYENEEVKNILDKYRRLEAVGPLTPLNI